MDGLSPQEIERAKFAFSIYDMDGTNVVDACRLGDLLRALELTPTMKTINKLGGTTRRGYRRYFKREKQLTVEEFLPIYADAKKDKDVGHMDDYIEVLKLYDKEENGLIAANQLSHLLVGYGEKLDHEEALEIMNDCCDPCDDDGFTKWMPFVRRLCEGPPDPDTLAALKGNKSSAQKDKVAAPATVVEYDMEKIPSVSYSEAKPMADLVIDDDVEQDVVNEATDTLKKHKQNKVVNPMEGLDQLVAVGEA